MRSIRGRGMDKESHSDVHARVSVLEQQMVGQKENTALALAAADKTIANAVAKVELAATQKSLEDSITALRDAFRQEISHQKELTAQALASSDKAITKAELAYDKRFEGVNEFRNQLSDQTATFIPRTEVDIRFKALEDRMGEMALTMRGTAAHGEGGHMASNESRAFMFSVIAATVAIGVLLISIFNFFNKGS